MNQTEAETYQPDPAAESAWVVEAFFAALGERLADQPESAALLAAARSASDELTAGRGASPERAMDRHHLLTGAAVLGAYRALRGKMDQQPLLALLHDCFNQPLRQPVLDGTVAMLDSAPDPFGAMVATSKAREIHFFGDSFAFERPRDDERGYYADVTRCFWNSFLRAEGAPELMPIFCDFDANWFDAIDPRRHGFRFERATTLGYGGALCSFHFFRLAEAGS
ncbi:MAG TPA: L-2-amino-thiazoline-4-carboxylic acid hydrolase [Herpetosiphonaceae bacterium]